MPWLLRLSASLPFGIVVASLVVNERYALAALLFVVAVVVLAGLEASVRLIAEDARGDR